MQTKFLDGSLGVCGKATKDAEFKFAGEKHSHITTFSIVVGKRKDTTTIFVNCKAWHGLADYAADIKKGDPVYAIGTTEDREYNGKTYTDFTCEWINFTPCTQATPPIKGEVVDSYKKPAHVEDFAELENDGDTLPF